MADDPLAELSNEEKKRLARLAKDNPDVSRRNLMQAGGAIGLGALLGGGGTYAATDKASAQASTSDDDGNIGLPGDRVDGFFDGINANSIETSEQNQFIFASENDPDLPSLQNAATMAGGDPGKAMVVVPGDHGISNSISFSDPIQLFIFGQINATADITALEFRDYAHVITSGWSYQGNISSEVSGGTTPGVIFRSKFTVSGPLHVGGYHGDGIVITSDPDGGGGGNLNTSTGSFIARLCEGDGVRITRGSGSSPTGSNDLNGMSIQVPNAFNNGGYGIKVRGGFGSFLEAGAIESNSNGGLLVDGYSVTQTASWGFKIGDVEGHNSGDGLVLTQYSSGTDIRVLDNSNGETDNGNNNRIAPWIREQAIENVIKVADDDSELTGVLNNTGSGGKIHLSKADFTVDRTLDSRYHIQGTGSLGFDGTRLQNITWTFNDTTQLSDLFVDAASGDQLVFNSDCTVENIGMGDTANIVASADRCKFYGLNLGTVTFESGTSGGIVDASSGTSVTDNGSNTTGDIA